MHATIWAVILNAIKAVTFWLFFFFVCLIKDQCLKEFLLDSHLRGRVQISVFLLSPMNASCPKSNASSKTQCQHD